MTRLIMASSLPILLMLLFLTGCGVAETQGVLPNDNCSAPPSATKKAAAWDGWGADAGNTRFQDARTAGLTRQSVPRLKLKWAFGFPGATEASTQPTVFGGRIFVGSRDGTVYSLDARTGCMYWMYKATARVRTPVVIDNRSPVAYFGDMQGYMYAVNADTGALKWKTRVDQHPYAAIAGAPKLEADRLYVPVSGGNEEAAAAIPSFVCCTFRGGILALDAENGKQIWKTYTIPDAATVTGRNAAGRQIFGPSGAGVWSSPTMDLQRRAIYVGTGVNYTDPPTQNSDAVLAFDMDSGRLLWRIQFTANDRFNYACFAVAASQQNLGNCLGNPGPNAGIGASPILRSLGGGRRVLIVGAKSGMVHALDPDREGRVVWEMRIGSGRGIMGGIMWGGASDDRGFAYFSVSDWDVARPDAGGGLIALRIATGEKVWFTPAPKPSCLGVVGCSRAQPGPATAIPDVVFVGSLDGHLRAHDTANGSVIWDFDTVQEFRTVNGVQAHGGSINRSGPTVAGGMLYSSSGYSQMPVLPGNVLLAFSVDGR